MNKLVIIGNGFDLAHGLKTSYKDFLLWYLNKIHGKNQSYHENVLLSFVDVNPFDSQFESLDDFNTRLKHEIIKVNYHYDFIKSLIEDFKKTNWVDIESNFYSKLVDIYKLKVGEIINISYSNSDTLKELNDCIEIIKKELEDYLLSNLGNKAKYNQEIYELFYEIGNKANLIDSDINKTTMMVLNFNYTDTFQLYFDKLTFPQHVGNYIHGKLSDSKNKIIFGYGDETDEYYEKLENLKNNEFLKHMKSFAYLQTPNYKKLFKFLDQEHLAEDKREKFDVYIMGHSCGVSDRLLFTHIFEHPLMNSVKLYYYERPDGTNDFYEKTQELSRHFRKDAKHKMRKCIVPFSESKPLPQFKQQN